MPRSRSKSSKKSKSRSASRTMSKSRSASRSRKDKLWHVDIEEATTKNKNWRKVLMTLPNMQVVVMSVPPRQELGWEKHTRSDQFFRLEGGRAIVQIGKKNTKKEFILDDEIELKEGSAFVIPHGTWHNVINDSSRTTLQFYTIYSPAHHPKNTIDKTHHAEEVRMRK